LNEKTKLAIALAGKGNPPLDYLLAALKRRGTSEDAKIRIALGLLPYYSPRISPILPEDLPAEAETPMLSITDTARKIAFLLEGARREQLEAMPIIEHNPQPKKKPK